MHRVFVWITLLAGVIACGHALAQNSQFAYVTADTNLLGFKIDAVTGDLTPVPGSPFATGQVGNSQVVIDQIGGFVYVVGFGGHVAGFKIEPFTGRLTPIPGGVLTQEIVESLAIDPLGRYAYAVQTQENVSLASVFAYRIDQATGQLCLIPGAPLPTGSDTSSIAVDPLGRFVYTPNQNSDTVSGFSINQANGTLTVIPGSPFTVASSPQTVAIDSLDRFAYVTQAGAGTTWAFTINPTTDVLMPLTPPSFNTGGIGSQAVDPRGMFLYSATLQGVSGFSIAQTTTGIANQAGGLTQIVGSPFGPTGGPGIYPVSIAVDYTGTFVYVAYYLGDIVGFKITAGNGVLTELPGSPLATADVNSAIAIAHPRANPMFAATLVPEGIFGPYKSFTASAINNLGEVTGTAVFLGGEPLSSAFLYDGTTTTAFGFPGANNTAGNALNDKGEIVGNDTGVPIGPFYLLTKSYLYVSPGVTFSLDTRPGGQSTATGINDAQHITGSISTGVCTIIFEGQCSDTTGLGNTHAFLDVGLGPTDIGTLGGDFSTGAGINQHDEVVGASNVTTGGPNHVFVYSHGSFHDVGMFNGYSSQGTAINDRGDIVGTAIPPSGSAVGFVYRNGGFARLRGLEGGTSSLPSGINLAGDVVGSSSVGSGGANHAFVYHDGKLVDLNRLVSPVLPLLTSAAGINDKGQIVASGLNGNLYVLTPIGDFPF
jgi:probable HAF family extracellular repeat protein